MNTNEKEQILLMLKALADESRLTLMRLLHEREYTVSDLALKINLSEPTVSHHLARLREAGLVTLRMAGNQRFYRINSAGLERFKQLADRIEISPPHPEPVISGYQWIADLGWEDSEQRELREHKMIGQLTSLPAKQKKMAVILRWLATLFEPDRLYSEIEVNEILKAVYAVDYISLRRDLVDFGYLRRERGGGKYWLAPAESENIKN